MDSGPFDLEDTDWLKVLPQENLPTATQHFIGDGDSLYSSARSYSSSADIFELGDDVWQMHKNVEYDESARVA